MNKNFEKLKSINENAFNDLNGWMPERIKKKRIRDTTETRVVEGNHKLVKSEGISTCGLCKKEGHNRRTCEKKDCVVDVLQKQGLEIHIKGKQNVNMQNRGARKGLIPMMS